MAQAAAAVVEAAEASAVAATVLDVADEMAEEAAGTPTVLDVEAAVTRWQQQYLM